VQAPDFNLRPHLVRWRDRRDRFRPQAPSHLSSSIVAPQTERSAEPSDFRSGSAEAPEAASIKSTESGRFQSGCYKGASVWAIWTDFEYGFAARWAAASRRGARNRNRGPREIPARFRDAVENEPADQPDCVWARARRVWSERRRAAGPAGSSAQLSRRPGSDALPRQVTCACPPMTRRAALGAGA
jgi:hypothetical protein